MYILTDADLDACTRVYGSDEPNECMAYAYAYGRMDAGSKVRVSASGVSPSEVCWFAACYVEQSGVGYGYASAWKNFENSGGRTVEYRPEFTYIKKER